MYYQMWNFSISHITQQTKLPSLQIELFKISQDCSRNDLRRCKIPNLYILDSTNNMQVRLSLPEQLKVNIFYVV